MEARGTAGVWLLLHSSTVALNPGAAWVTMCHTGRFCPAPRVCFDLAADYFSPQNLQSRTKSLRLISRPTK